jgi:hypothetical protein
MDNFTFPKYQIFEFKKNLKKKSYDLHMGHFWSTFVCIHPIAGAIFVIFIAFHREFVGPQARVCIPTLEIWVSSVHLGPS